MSHPREDLEGSFSRMVEERLEWYFDLHRGENIPPGLYRRILAEVEQALFRVTLRRSNGNNFKAAQMLGINRNTLRRKIEKSPGESNT
jgi:two-component system nitrogen regulation response regulator GlnG